MSNSKKIVLVPQSYARHFQKHNSLMSNIITYTIRRSERQATRHIPHRIRSLFKLNHRISYEQHLIASNTKNVNGVILNWNAQEEDLRLILQVNKNIEWVHCIHAGIDHLPTNLLFDKGITLTSGKGLKTTTIAEYAMGLIYLKAKRFLLHTHSDQNTIIRSEPLHQSKLLIFGAGSIGSKIAELAKANGMRTLGVNTSGKQSDHFDKIIKFSEFNPSGLSVNFIVIAAPLTADTHNYFNDGFFNAIKQPVHVINISREGLIDLHALNNAMRTGKVLSAALDTNKTRSNSIFKANKNIILTNHSAFASTVETHEPIERALQNAFHFINQRELLGVISPDKGY